MFLSVKHNEKKSTDSKIYQELQNTGAEVDFEGLQKEKSGYIVMTRNQIVLDF